MPHNLPRAFTLAIALVLLWTIDGRVYAADPLSTWNDGANKQAIVEFVSKTTDPASPDFVPVAERIATFDNDGTLWIEHPMYTQLAFVLDRVKALAPQHAEWKTTQPFKAALEGDMKTLAASGDNGLLQLVMATHSGMSTAEFETEVKAWLASAKHPRFKRSYTELTYKPMVELLEYLRANDFKTYIVSGGGIEFMRPVTEALYGIPPEQVIGSSIKTQYEMKDGKPVLMRLPEINFIDDKTGKPVGINMYIGRRPIASFGNSNGDVQMLEWTTAGDGARLGMLVFHDDAEREYAYGPANGLDNSPFGTFSQATMDEARKKGWGVISMKKDWGQVFAAQE
jgi:phosphoglycolate phosphatase-like HAD superfamily hydrolase